MAPKFKPGGKRFPPKVAAKPAPQQVLEQPPPQANSTAGASTSTLDLEAENKFELELCWCVQQLELSMASSKLGEKQTRDAQKNLKLLKSNSVPLIQKRQIMRTTFGDYRQKMLQEEKKHKNVATVKIITPKTKQNKSVFIKKARGSTDAGENNVKEEINGESSNVNLAQMFKRSRTDQPFQFNFTNVEGN